MTRPAFTDPKNLAGLMPVIIGVPCDRKLLEKAAEQTAAELRGNPWLAEWYHLPFVSMVSNVLRAVLADVPTWHAVDPLNRAELPAAAPAELTDDHRKLLLRKWLLEKVPGTVASEQVMYVVDASYSLWAEADGATEECWSHLVQVVQQSVELGLAAASF